MSTEHVSEAQAAYGVMDRVSKAVEPWNAARHWTEEEYLAFDENQLIEFNNGVVEILPMPSDFHQAISRMITVLLYILDPLQKLGIARYSPLKVKIPGGKYREPDILFVLREHDALRGERFWSGADLVMEIVSPDGEHRDRVEKRLDYAAAGIAEYWIIDPEIQTITVLKLDGSEYVEHGVFKRGEVATSVLLKGFSVDVTAIFNAE